MRDKNRISPFLNVVGDVWRDNFPDWRFGQLIVNFTRWHESTYGNDPFFIEEDKFVERFEKFAGEL